MELRIDRRKDCILRAETRRRWFSTGHELEEEEVEEEGGGERGRGRRKGRRNPVLQDVPANRSCLYAVCSDSWMNEDNLFDKEVGNCKAFAVSCGNTACEE